MTMAPIAHPGRLLKRELGARKLSANRLSLDIGVVAGRITGTCFQRCVGLDAIGSCHSVTFDIDGRHGGGQCQDQQGASHSAASRSLARIIGTCSGRMSPMCW